MHEQISDNEIRYQNTQKSLAYWAHKYYTRHIMGIWNQWNETLEWNGGIEFPKQRLQ